MRSKILYYIYIGLARAALWVLALDAWLDGACCFNDAKAEAAEHMKGCIQIEEVEYDHEDVSTNQTG